MKLRHRLANCVGMFIGGIFLALIGFGSAMAVGGWFAIFPSVFGVLGLLWIFVAVRILTVRSQMAIEISPSGLEVPAESVLGSTGQRLLLEWSAIASVAKHESLRGRGVEIKMRDGRQGFIQIRNYCEIDDFLELCKKHDIGIAQPVTPPYSEPAARSPQG